MCDDAALEELETLAFRWFCNRQGSLSCLFKSKKGKQERLGNLSWRNAGKPLLIF